MSTSAPARPVVSVLITAYNHAQFIRQTVQSALDQVCSFPIEIVIGDDGSSDHTLDIIKQLVAEHPGIVRNVSSGKRLGIGGNFHHVYTHCQGDFIAMLDSDDYWLSSDKLERQIELLRGDPRCVLSYHNAILLAEATGEARTKLSAPVDDVHDSISFLTRNPITTSTAVFRQVLSKQEVESLIELTIQDLPLWMMLAERGSMRCLPNLFAVYRVHGGGTYSTLGQTEALLARRKSMAIVRNFLSPAAGAAIEKRVVRMHLELVLRRVLLTRQFDQAASEWKQARDLARKANLGTLVFLGQMLQAAKIVTNLAFKKAGNLVGAPSSGL